MLSFAHLPGRPKQKPDGTYSTSRQAKEGLNFEAYEQELKQQLTSMMPRQLRRNKEELQPEETYYGLCQTKQDIKGQRGYLIVKRLELIALERKKSQIENILDQCIRNDLLVKYEQLSKEEWSKLLSNYRHPSWGSPVKKVKYQVISQPIPESELVYDQAGRLQLIDKYGNFAKRSPQEPSIQLRRCKQNQGQLLYLDKKGKVKVRPLYNFVPASAVKEELAAQGVELYEDAAYYSGCLFRITKPVNCRQVSEEKDQETKKTKKSSERVTIKPGIYINGSLKKKGDCEFKNVNGEKFVAGISSLVEAGLKFVE